MGTVTGVIFTKIVPGGLSTNLVVTVSGLVGNIFLTASYVGDSRCVCFVG